MELLVGFFIIKYLFGMTQITGKLQCGIVRIL